MEEALEEKNGVMKVAVPTGAVLAIVHSLAVINDWYRSIPWIDTLVHFWWAVTLGLVVYWLIERFPGHVDLGKNLLVTVLVGLSLAALGGVLWEFGEFIYDFISNLYSHNPKPVQFGLDDTLGDMFFNLLGGAAVAIFAWLRYHRK